MDYFVSIEHTNYFFWQTELLIQSFKKLGIQDDLVIAIARYYQNPYKQFVYNLSSHKRKFIHENVGREKGCLPLNRLFSLLSAIKNGYIKQPFAILHADMVLVAPIPDIPNDSIYIELESESESINTDPIETHLNMIKEVKVADVLPKISLGPVVIFNNIPISFFERTYQKALELLTHSEDPIEKYAWLLTLYENLGKYQYAYVKYVNFMGQEELNWIIHYNHGTTPAFNKLHFTYEPISMNINPYSEILNQTSFPSTLYIQKTCLDYLQETKQI